MKGLLFTPEMARAVIAGRKTQTRRVVPGKLKQYEEGWSLNGDAPRTLPGDWCTYQPGETVCLLTTWAVAKQFDDKRPMELSPRTTTARFWHAGMGMPKPEWAGKSRPGRFLPNTLRHLMPALRIVDVDMQRVRQISEADAAAEGVITRWYLLRFEDSSALIQLSPDQPPPAAGELIKCGRLGLRVRKIIEVSPRHARDAFRVLWNSIPAERGYSWSRNPQVFVIKFEAPLPF